MTKTIELHGKYHELNEKVKSKIDILKEAAAFSENGIIKLRWLYQVKLMCIHMEFAKQTLIKLKPADLDICEFALNEVEKLLNSETHAG